MNNNHGRRRTRRARNKQKQRKAQLGRILLTACLMGLIAVVSIGGTIAWLTSTTDTIENTFSTAGIKIELTETENVVDGEWNAQMIPGKQYKKNPKVTVDRSETDVDIYLFVKFEEINSPDQYLLYTSTLNTDYGWKQVDTDKNKNVWYREVLKDERAVDDEDPYWYLLADNKVTINEDLGGTIMPANTVTPKLVYTAYAIQTEGTGTAAEAWEKISK